MRLCRHLLITNRHTVSCLQPLSLVFAKHSCNVLQARADKQVALIQDHSPNASLSLCLARQSRPVAPLTHACKSALAVKSLDHRCKTVASDRQHLDNCCGADTERLYSKGHRFTQRRFLLR